MTKIPNHDKYSTTKHFNKVSGTVFDERLKQAKLATKNDIADFDEKLRKINNKVT